MVFELDHQCVPETEGLISRRARLCKDAESFGMDCALSPSMDNVYKPVPCQTQRLDHLFALSMQCKLVSIVEYDHPVRFESLENHGFRKDGKDLVPYKLCHLSGTTRGTHSTSARMRICPPPWGLLASACRIAALVVGSEMRA